MVFVSRWSLPVFLFSVNDLCLTYCHSPANMTYTCRSTWWAIIAVFMVAAVHGEPCGLGSVFYLGTSCVSVHPVMSAAHMPLSWHWHTINSRELQTKRKTTSIPNLLCFAMKGHHIIQIACEYSGEYTNVKICGRTLMPAGLHDNW